MNRQQLFEFMRSTYGVEADFPWQKEKSFAVFRHAGNKKWFALLMDVKRKHFAQNTLLQKELLEEKVDILNLKCSPVLLGALLQKQGVFEAYHMNKANWISVEIGKISDEDLQALIAMSWDLTK